MYRPLSVLCLSCIVACNDPSEADPTTASTPDPTDPSTEPTDPTDGSTELPDVDLPEANIVLNELMARNDSTWTGPDGDRPDWVELVNLSAEPVQLRRLALIDAAGNEWRNASGWIDPAERLLLTPGELGFGLGAANDSLTLEIDGEVVDEVSWVDLERDVALARTPDLVGDFARTALPTPGAGNLAQPSATLDAAEATIFVTDTVHRIDITLTDQAIDVINSNSENWGEATLAFDGQEFDSVGLRLKGSASFDLLNDKPALKVDMNKGVPGTRLRTLKGFNLHNGNVFDPTRQRDHLSYTLARAAGLMAPRIGWAELYINEGYFGIYILVEAHDDQMIEVNFPGLGETGYLYEPNEGDSGGFSWGDFGNGDAGGWDVEEGPLPPPPEITNALQQVDALVAGNATDAAVEALWSYVDQEALYSYMAWESVTSHTDGYKAPNNWRVFVHPTDAKVHLVPAGAEWTWDFRPSTLSWGGNLADWCLDNQGCRRGYGARTLEVAAMVEELELREDFEEVGAMLAPIIAIDPRSPHSAATVASQRESTLENLRSYPEDVIEDICDDMPGIEGCAL